MKTFLLFFLIISPLFAQKKVIFFCENQTEKQILENYHYLKQVPDSLAKTKEIQNLLNNLHKDGYLLAFALPKNDSIFLSINQKFYWVNLQKGNVSENILRKINFKEKFYQKKIFRWQEVQNLQKQILTYSENNGFPFASVRLDSIQISENQVFAKLFYESGSQIVFDSLIIEGNSKVKKSFLIDFLGIKKGQIFSQQKIKESENLLKTLPYIQLIRPIQTIFKYGRAFLVIAINHQKTSQFDGIVGFLPNSSLDKSLQLSGQINLKLENLFASGKTLHIDWQRLRPNSQLLKAEYTHKNFLNLKFDIQLKINLLQEDSSFLNLSRNITFAYPLANLGKISVFGEWRNTTANKDSVNLFVRSQIVNTNFFSYGIGYSWQNLDSRQSPKKGWLGNADFAVGTKNSSPKNLSDSLLQSLKISSQQWTFRINLQYFLPTGKESTLLLRSQMGFIGNNYLFLNELYRMGGLNMLRGFNENSFFASQYLLNTLEWRLYFEKTSSIFAFVDQAFLKYNLPSQSFADQPVGFGFGFNFATQSGMFNFAYALGKSANQNFNLQQSKIHFGIVNRF